MNMDNYVDGYNRLSSDSLANLEKELYLGISETGNSIIIKEISRNESIKTSVRLDLFLKQFPHLKRLELDFEGIIFSDYPLLSLPTFQPTELGWSVMHILESHNFTPFPRVIVPRKSSIKTNLSFKKISTEDKEENFEISILTSIDKLTQYNPISLFCKNLPNIGYSNFIETLYIEGRWSNSVDFVGLNRNIKLKHADSVSIGMWVVPYSRNLTVIISPRNFYKLLQSLIPANLSEELELLRKELF